MLRPSIGCVLGYATGAMEVCSGMVQWKCAVEWCNGSVQCGLQIVIRFIIAIRYRLLYKSCHEYIMRPWALFRKTIW